MTGINDFDFLIGEWSVLHLRLKRRLVGDTEWIEFSGPALVRKILGGLGNFDEFRKKAYGLSVRHGGGAIRGEVSCIP